MDKPRITSLEDLVLRVPAEWTTCDIAVASIQQNISNAWEVAEAIERISFHEDADGKHLLLLHRNTSPNVI